MICKGVCSRMKKQHFLLCHGLVDEKWERGILSLLKICFHPTVLVDCAQKYWDGCFTVGSKGFGLSRNSLGKNTEEERRLQSKSGVKRKSINIAVEYSIRTSEMGELLGCSQ